MKKIKGRSSRLTASGRIISAEWNGLSDLLKGVERMFDSGYVTIDPISGYDERNDWYKLYVGIKYSDTMYFSAYPYPSDDEQSRDVIEVPLSELLGPASEIKEVQEAFLKHVRAKFKKYLIVW